MIPLNDTIDLMTSPYYKDRVVGEYFQLKFRSESLEKMIRDYKAGNLALKPGCSAELLERQLQAMKAYKEILEERARLEDIDLAGTWKNLQEFKEIHRK